MEERIEKYLPLGTLCLLKGGERYIMVIGYLGMENPETETIYDYLGVAFPFGVISSDINFMFNHEQIEKIIYKGYENGESKSFLDNLKGYTKETVLKEMKKMMNADKTESTSTSPEETVAPESTAVNTSETATQNPYAGIEALGSSNPNPMNSVGANMFNNQNNQ